MSRAAAVSSRWSAVPLLALLVSRISAVPQFIPVGQHGAGFEIVAPPQFASPFVQPAHFNQVPRQQGRAFSGRFGGSQRSSELQALQPGDACVTTEGHQGRCVSFSSQLCATSLDALLQERPRLCGRRGLESLFCCSEPPARRVETTTNPTVVVDVDVFTTVTQEVTELVTRTHVVTERPVVTITVTSVVEETVVVKPTRILRPTRPVPLPIKTVQPPPLPARPVPLPINTVQPSPLPARPVPLPIKTVQPPPLPVLLPIRPEQPPPLPTDFGEAPTTARPTLPPRTASRETLPPPSPTTSSPATPPHRRTACGLRGADWVALVGSSRRWLCSGVLVWHRLVLTSARCVAGRPADELLVRLGVKDLRLATNSTNADGPRVERVVTHPHASGGIHDLALLYLSDDSDISPICLPSSVIDRTFTSLSTLGWGLSASSAAPAQASTLASTLVSEVGSFDCDAVYRSFPTYRREFPEGVGGTEFCVAALGEDTPGRLCPQDRGGALVGTDLRGVSTLLGVMREAAGCGSVILPGLYTRVKPYMGWIGQVVEQLEV